MKILTVLGARPQFIKAAAVSRVLASKSSIREVIVHTGQHYDANMSDSFFNDLDIPKPGYKLSLKGGSHGAMTGGMLADTEEIILAEKPDWVMVYGDTNSTIAGALAASKLHVPVAHVEAGLRSFNMRMPEEINRILTDRISKVLFCPTDTAVRQLEKEAFSSFPVDIVKSGDVMQDAALFYAEVSAQRSSIIQDLKLEEEAFVLATVHRAENTDNPTRLKEVFKGLEAIEDKGYKVVLPLHPRTAKCLKANGIKPSIKLIEPVGYFAMIELLKHAKMVATDSGGLQKEAYFFHNPCLTLRDETEWTELVEVGANQLVGASAKEILNGFLTFKDQEVDFTTDLYGGGNASETIANYFLQGLQ